MPRAILPMSCTQALSHADADGCDSASTCRVHERLDALAPFARVSLRRQLPLEDPTPAPAEKRLRCDECGAVLAGAAAAQRHMEEKGCCMFSEI